MDIVWEFLNLAGAMICLFIVAYTFRKMRIDWHSLNLFGVAMRIPVLRFIIRKTEERITEFAKYSGELSACDTCHRLTSAHLGVRMIMHLKLQHGLNEDRSIAIVEDIWREVLILKPRRQAQNGD